MKRKHIFVPLIFTMGLALSSCDVFEKNVDVVVMNISNPTAAEESWTYEEVYRSKVNIFNSAILPINNVTITGKRFLGYGLHPFEKGVSKRKDFYKNKGLVRYNDVKNYVVNGTVTLNATFVNPDDFPYQYIVFGWYGKTSTSGLNEDIMTKFERMLRNYIGDKVTTPTDIEVREYLGDVATIGANINFDEDVDIFLGAGVNLGSSGKVEYVARNAYDIKGVADRYIYKLSDRDSTNDIYDWVRTKEVKDFFKRK